MRSLLKGSIIALVLWALPVQAQVSDTQIGALVEALRLAAPQTGTKNDGLYSDWQILPANIPRWSKACIGRQLSIAEFEASPVTARTILACVIRDVLRDEYRASGSNESIAVRRVATWWMTGDSKRYDSPQTGPYTQKVLSFYRQQIPLQPAEAVRQLSDYDRYMQLGYTATQKKDYQTALINFKRALSDRPADGYATRAIQSVESYIKQSPGQPAVTTQPSPPVTTISQQQAIDLINQWLQAKQQIFAPPFDRRLVAKLTTGELSTALTKPDGTLTWLKNNNAYYRFGVQKVESVQQFVANGDKAAIEVDLTEDRTLYRNGRVDASQTAFATQLIRYSLESVNGTWKITDYKTGDGSVLERTISE